MIEKLRARAELLAKIREFFAARGVLEVETPMLCHTTIPDPNIHSFITQCNLYLQTSPEFAMKRLLAAGSGSIYQICKAFRNEESGSQHNPEFTILEWYRVGFDHHQLMAEMDELLQNLLNTISADKLTYRDIFLKYLQIDPLSSSINELQQCAQQRGLNYIPKLDRDGWLNILLTHYIEPHLGINNKPTFIYEFPASQAALAKISKKDPRVAERFEVYIDGTEIANGFHELADGKEQRQRFLNDLEQRKQLELPDIPLDEDFLTALDNGFPDCAGVAMGVDRLLMLSMGIKNIKQVLPFSI